MTRAGRILLGLVLLAAIVAPWLAPNAPDRTFSDALYAPPTTVHLVRGQGEGKGGGG